MSQLVDDHVLKLAHIYKNEIIILMREKTHLFC